MNLLRSAAPLGGERRHPETCRAARSAPRAWVLWLLLAATALLATASTRGAG